MTSTRSLVPVRRTLLALAFVATPAAAQIQSAWIDLNAPSPGSGSPAGGAHRVTVDGAGSIYTASIVDSHPHQGLRVKKLDAAGTPQWTASILQLVPALYPKAIAVSSSGASIVAGIAGSSTPYGAAPTRAVLARLDPTGALSWTSLSTASANSIYDDVQLDAANNVYACGALGTTGVVRKLDASGAELWQSSASGASRFFALELDASGDAFVVARRADMSPFVARLDAATGNALWVTDLGTVSPFGSEFTLIRDGLGSIYVVGGTSVVAPTTELVKLNAGGAISWRTPLSIVLAPYMPGSMTLDVYGRVVVGGHFSAAVVTPSGAVVWARQHDAFGSGSLQHGLATDAVGSIYQVCIRQDLPPATRGAVLVYDASGEQQFAWDDYALSPTNYARRLWSVASSSTGRAIIVGVSSSGKDYVSELERTSRAFCFGDGSATACPCGNDSPIGANAGCASSIGVGARLVDAGASSIAQDSLSLRGSSMPNSSAMYFQGTLSVAGGAGSVFGDGLRCAGGAIIRLGVQLNVGGESMYPAAGDAPVSVRGLVPGPATSRTYQVWYRNSASFCTTATFNLTNGLEVTWTN